MKIDPEKNPLLAVFGLPGSKKLKQRLGSFNKLMKHWAKKEIKKQARLTKKRNSV